MSSEYIIGIVTGVLVTTFGFGLTLIYEWGKEKEKAKKEKIKILSLLSNELSYNLEIAKENLKLFSLDIDLINHHRGYVTQSPALYFDSGWHIALANDIYSFVGVKKYQLIAEAYLRLTYSNAYVTARESYRMSQDQTTNAYPSVLLVHDQKLLDYFQEDIGRISLAIGTIEEFKKSI